MWLVSLLSAIIFSVITGVGLVKPSPFFPYTGDMANKSLTVGAGLCCWLAALTLLPTQAAAQCQLCAEDAVTAAAKKPLTPLVIQIETRIDFSRIGLVQIGQGGTAVLSAVTGQRT